MSQRLAGKAVLVTGSGSGYGAHLAIGAAHEGARAVIVHYRSSRDGAERTAEAVRAAGSEAILVQGDITRWDDIKAFVADAYEQAGSIEVLINNIGDVVSQQDSWRDITEEWIDHCLAVDIKGTMLCIHEVGTRMLERDGGVIINIGSTVITRGSPRAPQYAAGKYGVLGLTKSYAKAFAPTVRVNTFAPGFMATETMQRRKDWRSGRREELIAATPLGRIPGPEEFVGPVMFLASDDAAHLTGGLLMVDGGMALPGA
jgi:3-oxoacyl-[acyl-carrier protein] reductase